MNFVRDISSQEGRTNEAVAMPAFGKNVHITSRRQLKELQKRTRDRMWEETFGEHHHFVDDPETGKKEKITINSEGIDSGEIHTQEKPATEYKGEDPKKVLDDIMKKVRS